MLAIFFEGSIFYVKAMNKIFEIAMLE